VEKNPNKGWYNTKAQCQKHCDRLNEAEEKAGRLYEKLDNGYVREMVTEATLHESTDFPASTGAGSNKSALPNAEMFATRGNR
jgi:hypothetical protein